MDLLEDDGPSNSPEFTVSELSGAVKRTIEGEFSHVRVRGELGRVSRPASGHVYLDLKDEKAVLSGVIWKGVASRIETKPEEGLEVIATGRLTTFPGQSRYQIIIEDLRPAGLGALMAMLEKRKKALEAEGLFAPEQKQPLPFLPEVIGVVTSPSGAVIRDILHRLRDRFPRKVLIWPVAVQGEKCAPEVVRAIEGFNALTPGEAIPRPDLLIVARGGGSIEDLWGFNEEAVARAAAASRIPLISAVGHETDTTLIDYVSDKRAPTPTAAAEIAVPVRLDLLAHIDGLGARVSSHAARSLSERQQRLRDLSRALPRKEALLDVPRQRLDTAARGLPLGLRAVAQSKRAAFAAAAGAVRPQVLSSRLEARRDALRQLGDRLMPSMTRLIKDQSRKVTENQERLGQIWARANPAFLRVLTQKSEALGALDRMRRSLGYEETLTRGYAVVWGDGAPVTTVKAAKAAGEIEIQFTDGRMRPQTASKPTRSKTKPDTEDQGSLF